MYVANMCTGIFQLANEDPSVRMQSWLPALLMSLVAQHRHHTALSRISVLQHIHNQLRVSLHITTHLIAECNSRPLQADLNAAQTGAPVLQQLETYTSGEVLLKRKCMDTHLHQLCADPTLSHTNHIKYANDGLDIDT